MNSLVGVKVGGVLKAFPTVETFKRFFSHVDSLVSDETPASAKALPTDTTLRRVFLLVGHMAHEIHTPSKAFFHTEEPEGPLPHKRPLMHYGFPQILKLGHQFSMSNSMKVFPLSS